MRYASRPLGAGAGFRCVAAHVTQRRKRRTGRITCYIPDVTTGCGVHVARSSEFQHIHVLFCPMPHIVRSVITETLWPLVIDCQCKFDHSATELTIGAPHRMKSGGC